MLGQSLRVVRQQQPPGAAGVNYSLEQVAKKIAEGGVHPKVRAWTVEQLERGRRELGLKMDCERDRASTLLRAVQRKLWTPDPTGSEFVVGAHLMSCDRSSKTEICFLGGDCDDLTVLLGSCFLSAGLQVSVVGHAFDGGKNISHVLTAVRVDGRWLYADPTPNDFKLGEAVSFTREKILSVPNVRVVCDADVCFKDGSEFHPRDHDFVVEGRFIGVDGLPPRPKFFWIKPISALGQEQQGEQISVESVVKRCTAGRGTTKEDLKGAAGCAADIFCGTYGVPPGLCGGTVEFVLDVIDEVFSAKPGFGFEGYVNRSMYMHNKLFPNEPRWWWDRAKPLQGMLLPLGPTGAGEGYGYYVPNAPVRAAYAATNPPYIITSGFGQFPDLSTFAAASLQVQATLNARAAKERASGEQSERKTSSKLLPIAAVGAAGAAAWYFWGDIVRFFR